MKKEENYDLQMNTRRSYWWTFLSQSFRFLKLAPGELRYESRPRATKKTTLKVSALHPAILPWAPPFWCLVHSVLTFLEDGTAFRVSLEKALNNWQH